MMNNPLGTHFKIVFFFPEPTVEYAIEPQNLREFVSCGDQAAKSPAVCIMKRIRKLDHLDSRDIHRNRYTVDKTRRDAVKRQLFRPETDSDLPQSSDDVDLSSELTSDVESHTDTDNTDSWSNRTFEVDPKTSLLRQRIRQATKVARAARRSLSVRRRSSKASTNQRASSKNTVHLRKHAHYTTDTEFTDSSDYATESTDDSDSSSDIFPAQCFARPGSLEECLFSRKVTFWRNVDDCACFNDVDFF